MLQSGGASSVLQGAFKVCCGNAGNAGRQKGKDMNHFERHAQAHELPCPRSSLAEPASGHNARDSSHVTAQHLNRITGAVLCDAAVVWAVHSPISIFQFTIYSLKGSDMLLRRATAAAVGCGTVKRVCQLHVGYRNTALGVDHPRGQQHVSSRPFVCPTGITTFRQYSTRVVVACAADREFSVITYAWRGFRCLAWVPVVGQGILAHQVCLCRKHN